MSDKEGRKKKILDKIIKCYFADKNIITDSVLDLLNCCPHIATRLNVLIAEVFVLNNGKVIFLEEPEMPQNNECSLG